MMIKLETAHADMNGHGLDGMHDHKAEGEQNATDLSHLFRLIPSPPSLRKPPLLAPAQRSHSTPRWPICSRCGHARARDDEDDSRADGCDARSGGSQTCVHVPSTTRIQHPNIFFLHALPMRHPVSLNPPLASPMPIPSRLLGLFRFKVCLICIC